MKNYQPFYHAAEIKGDKKTIIAAIKAIRTLKTVIKDTVEWYNDELLFTATTDVSDYANTSLESIHGLTIVFSVSAEAGDPADLL